MSDHDSVGDRPSLRERERSSLSLDDPPRGVAQTSRRVDCSFRQDSDEGSSSSLRSRLCGAAEPVAAVSTKMGYSVVSLDFPTTASSRKTSTASSTSKSSSSYQKGCKKAKPSVKKAAQGRERRLKKTSSMKGVEEITDALCITPLVTPRDYLEDVDQGTNSSSDDPDEDGGELVHDPRVYGQMAGQTRSVYRFEKVAYPDLYGVRGAFDLEPLYNRKFGVQR